MSGKSILQSFIGRALALAFGFGALGLMAQSTATYTQNITLNPGWNSIYLEVTPTDTNIADVFSDPAITTVWQPRVRTSTVAYLQNPNELPFNTAGWMTYMPTNNPASVNNDLYVVAANTPYVIQVSGNKLVNLSVTGRPSLAAAPYTPDGFTLRGFPVDPANPPTFQSFFQWSPALFTGGNNLSTNIYRLDSASGDWVQVNAQGLMQRGAAYWVYISGNSSYLAPLTASCAVQDGLDFGQGTFELDLTLQNLTTNAMTVVLNDLGGLPRPLSYEAANPTDQTQQWTPLQQSLVTNIPANSTTILQFGIQRDQIALGTYGTVLTLSDGLGTQLRVPVTAQSADYLQAGLWVGDISVNAVAETYNNISNTTPTASPFTLRAILHVTPLGATRFLRDVIEMTQNAVTSTNASGQVTIVQPAQPVLLTDSSLLSQFSGAVLRDGTPVGRRVSTAGFDFDPPGGTNFLAMSGTFGVNNTVGVAITMTPASPVNPFLHRYHPDHDNLNASYQPLPAGVPPEVYTITRQISLTFTSTDPSGQSQSDYGVNEIGGTYNETITGLHRHPLVVSGTFHLVHTVNAPFLNVNQ